MEKIKIKIISHEDKTSKNGKDYSMFMTTDGKYSVFEADVIKALKENEGKGVVIVGVARDGNFSNIREFNGKLEEHLEDEEISDPKNDQSTQEANLGDQIPQEIKGSFKDYMIIAQTLTKCVCEVMKTSETKDDKTWLQARREILKSYKDFLAELSI